MSSYYVKITKNKSEFTAKLHTSDGIVELGCVSDMSAEATVINLGRALRKAANRDGRYKAASEWFGDLGSD